MNWGFNYIGEKLHNTTVKITNFTSNFSFMSKPGEIYYSIKDGLWSDTSVWETVSGRIGKTPTANDDVYIHHVVSIDGPNPVTWSMNNLFISTTGTLTAVDTNMQRTFNIFGNIQCLGKIDFTIVNALANFTLFFNLYGDKNRIDSFKCTPTGSNIIGTRFKYCRVGDQTVLPLPYDILELQPITTIPAYDVAYIIASKRFAGGDITCRYLDLQADFELGNYNLTVTGSTNLQGYSSLRKNGAGYVLFIGSVISANPPTIDFSGGNPTVEFQGGFSFQVMALKSGTGIWKFTTNNQNINVNNGLCAFDCQLIVEGNITVTNTAASASALQVNNYLNGTLAGSNFINQGIVYFNNASNFTMATGTFDKDTYNTNIVGYVFNGSITLPYITYQGLYIAGTGIKTSLGNTTLGANLDIGASATYQLSSFDLTVTGTTILTYRSYLLKSGTGNVLFIGYARSSTMSGIDFRTGNPNVECRGGLRYGNNDAGQYTKLGNFYIQGGLGKWSFTTNNQITTVLAGSNFARFQDIDIAAGITLTMTTLMQIEGTLNGLSSTSKLLLNNGVLVLNTSVQPMITGILDITTNINTVYYVMDGTFTLWHTAYWHLNITQCTGTKTLAGNTTINGDLYIDPSVTIPCVLNTSTFSMTVNGTTTVSGRLNNTGGGSMIFGGQFKIGNGSGSTGQCFIDFSGGNPAVEFRNGIYIVNQLAANFLTGTGTWTFTTNNQIFGDISGGGSFVNINCPILISGAITLTIPSAPSTFQPTFLNTVNGNNAASTLDNRVNNPNSYLNYQNATQPMLTGVLQCNAAANTFKYNMANNQNVSGGTYRTIEFGGSGIKTLQGNIVVNVTAGGSQLTTGTATINLNGFSITTI